MGNSNRRDSDDGFSPPQLVDNNEKLTPLKKLRDQLKICENKPRRRLAVLVATGSYCPIHKMHVEVFDSAKKHLEEEYNYYVVGGFLSPSHHFHVHAKVGDFAIPIEDRVKMAQLAVKDSDWIEVSSWEGSQPFFVDLGAVTRQINEFIVQNIEEKYTNDMTVFYLCGADLAVRCGFHNRNGKRPMRFVGVCRPGYGEQLRKEWKEYVERNPLPANDTDKMDIDEENNSQPNNSNINNTPERHFILIESETEDFSSTAVRDCIIGGKFAEMEKMLDKNVAEYIRAKNYFDYAEILKNTEDPRFKHH